MRRGPAVNIDCQVRTPDFEGPLDLLLHLIKSHEMDILNLSVSGVTRQYLMYLDYMREMNLDLASEYLVMAATLTYLKSQVILPQEGGDEATGNDPRAQLIRRLIELKCYKELAAALSQRPRLFRDTFLCRNNGAEEIEASIEPEVALSNPFQLGEAYTQLIERRKTITHHVTNDEVPIASCVAHIVNKLKENERVTFSQLLPTICRPQDLISMFLGVLEMSKMQISTMEQEEIFGPISITRKVPQDQLDRANKMIRGLSWE